MQVKSHPPMNVLYCSYQASLLTLQDKVGTVAKELYAEAARQQLLVAGPQYWFYYGMDGNPETIFTLEIAVPVSGVPETNEHFLFKELPAFKCMSVIHEGAWTELKKTYEKLIGEITKQNLKMNGASREMYINVDFNREECNLTEVQVGIS